MSWIFFVLVFAGIASSNETLDTKESNIIHAEEGETVNITCWFLFSNIKGLYLKRTILKPLRVLYAAEHGKTVTLESGYRNRTEYFQLQDRALIIVQQVQKSDSDVYTCQQIDEDINEKSTSVILAVRDKSVMKLEKCSSHPWMLTVIIILALLLVCVLGCLFLLHENVKKHCWKGNTMELQTIYEDMNSFKCNNNLLPNPYQT